MNESQLEELADQVAGILEKRDYESKPVLATVGEVALVAGVCYVAYKAVSNALYIRKWRKEWKKNR